ncbi:MULTISPECIES: amidohydrolase family protein [Nocardia]|uniref:amidohydrolase family protein n=1 Tax=Nocardia TaxID=1817 RepID=UPI000D699FA4|nr:MULTISPECIES: amidohydrolase family protein [Nocardia]
MLIQRATLLDGRRVDLRVGARIVAMDERLSPERGEEVFDAAGGAVVPGLHDHHVHLRSTAAAQTSARVGPPWTNDPESFAVALRTATPDVDGWIRAVGYHESVAGDIDRRALDAIESRRPMRVQHRSGALWIVNSPGLGALGMPDHPDGRLFRVDTDPGHTLPPVEHRLSRLGATLSGWGVTGVTDATPGQSQADIDALAAAHHSGELPQRPHSLAALGVIAVPGVTIGPVKIILDDETLDLDDLTDRAARCHRADRGIAVHCVTESQLAVTVAALEAAGHDPRDRIEHGALIHDDYLDVLAELGVTVVTQPNFVAERGDAYLRDIPVRDHPMLWRVASLLDRGVRLALSTDMPFGDGDPWAAMRAAVHRRTVGGEILGPAERISAERALALFCGSAQRPDLARRVEVGQPGDLCVLTAAPAQALAELASDMVALTVVGGHATYRFDATSTDAR